MNDELRRATATLALGFGLASLPAYGGDWAEIQAAAKLRAIVAQDEQREMYNPSEQGAPGFERELLEGFLRLHKLGLESVVVPRYADRVPALREGKGDLIIGILKTAAREKLIDFTSETLPTRLVTVTHKPHKLLGRPDELPAEKVGMLKGTTTWLAAALATGVEESKISFYPTLGELFAALRSGEVTATVMSISDFGLAKSRHPELQAGTLVGEPRSAGWGVRKEDGELLRMLNEYVTSVRRTPTWSRLVVKYFGEETLLVLGRQ